jgi:hypothetical protein
MRSPRVSSSMSRPEAERARAFLERADADLAAVRAMEAVDEVPDEIVGFHGQQAAEKLLKAVLAAHGIDFPRTHSLRFLLDLLDDRGLAPAFGPPRRRRALPVRRPAPLRGAARRGVPRPSGDARLARGSSSLDSRPRVIDRRRVERRRGSGQQTGSKRPKTAPLNHVEPPRAASSNAHEQTDSTPRVADLATRA